MNKYNQKFWIEEYSKKENIIQWFKNYLTYLDDHFHELQNMQEIKNQYLKNEYLEITTIIKSKKDQQKAYNFTKNIIETLEV